MGNLNNDHLSYLISIFLQTLRSSSKHAAQASVLFKAGGARAKGAIAEGSVQMVY